MRPVSTALETDLDDESIVPLIRHIVTVTLRGGTVVRWTDHEADLVIGGNTYSAGAANVSATAPIVEVGECEQVAGVEIGTLSLRLLCGETASISGTRLPLAAVNGTFSGSNIKVERLYQKQDGVSWHDPMHWFEGPVGEVRPSSAVVELDVESGIALLNVMLPRIVYGPGCSNMLFDTQCDPDGSLKTANTYSVTATGTPTTREIKFDGTTIAAATRAADYFQIGVLTFAADTTTVALRGVVRAVRSDTYSSSTHTLTPSTMFPAVPVAGDTFSISAGCDLRYETCNTKFSNLVHLRCFKDVPRNETAL